MNQSFAMAPYRLIALACCLLLLITAIFENTDASNTLPTWEFGYGALQCSALSPDGTTLCTGSRNGNIYLWSIASGEMIRCIPIDSTGITLVEFSANSSKIIAVAGSGNAKLYDRETKTIGVFTANAGLIHWASFTDNDSNVIVASQESVTTISMSTGKILSTYQPGSITRPVMSPDGTVMITYLSGILIRNCLTGDTIGSIPGANVSTIAFSPDGKKIFTFINNDSAQIIDAATGERLVSFKNMILRWPSRAFFSPDGSTILLMQSAALNNPAARAELWDAVTGQLITTYGTYSSLIDFASFETTVPFSPNGSKLFLGTKLFDRATGDSLFDFNKQYGISFVAFVPDGTLLITGSVDNTIMIWNVATGTLVRTLWGHIDNLNDMAFSPDGSKLLTGNYDMLPRLWDIKTGSVIRGFWGHGIACDNHIAKVAFAPDGTTILTEGWDYTARLWNTATGELLRTFPIYSSPQLVAFSPDGSRLIIGTDREVTIRNKATGDSLFAIRLMSEDLQIASGSNVLFGGFSSAVLWNLETGDSVRLKGRYPYFRAAISPDCSMFVGDSGKTAMLYDAKTGTTIRTLSGHTKTIENAIFSPDGSMILTGADDNVLKLWKTSTGEVLRTFAVKRNRGWSDVQLAFSPDGKRIAAGGLDQSVAVWDISDLVGVVQPRTSLPESAVRPRLISSTTLVFSLPRTGIRKNATLYLYSLSGRLVQTYALGAMQHDGFYRCALPPGIKKGLYCYRLISGDAVTTGNIPVVRQ